MKSGRSTIIIIAFSLSIVRCVYSQPAGSDSSYHPYHVNYWVTGGVIVGGLALEDIGVTWISNKSTISTGELQNLDRNDISPIDSWVLKLNPSKIHEYKILSNELASVTAILPALTMIDPSIRKDWLDVLLIYMQTQTITNNLYLYSPFGTTFQNRLRPVVYYTSVDTADRTTSNNRNSMYSGHVAATAEASFFTAKIYCDYHPELGNNKYLVYGIASLPPLLMSYARIRALAHFPTDIAVGFGVGALCGILVPELHRIQTDNISVGIYSSSQATGIAMRWQTDLLR